MDIIIAASLQLAERFCYDFLCDDVFSDSSSIRIMTEANVGIESTSVPSKSNMYVLFSAFSIVFSSLIELSDRL